MPGFLSDLFDADDAGGISVVPVVTLADTGSEPSDGGQVTTADAGDDAAATSGSGVEQSGDLAADLDLGVSIGVAIATDVQYEELDGTTHSWSNDTELGVDVGTQALIGTAYTLGLAEDAQHSG